MVLILLIKNNFKNSKILKISKKNLHNFLKPYSAKSKDKENCIFGLEIEPVILDSAAPKEIEMHYGSIWRVVHFHLVEKG